MYTCAKTIFLAPIFKEYSKNKEAFKMNKGTMALTSDGQLTFCKAPAELRGKGNCPHVAHQEPNESIEDFIQRVEERIDVDTDTKEDFKSITQEQIDDYALRIDEIAGQKVTIDNWEEVLKNLPPEKIRQITELGFEAAPEFSLPITDENYGEESTSNKIYFSELPNYKISGKKTAIEQMFLKVGEVINEDGTIDIEGNYKKGLTPEEYFNKLFSSRGASIAKTVSISAPGYAIYAKQKVLIIDRVKNMQEKQR